MQTIKIKPSHESQGPFVIINAEDFDPSKHERYDEGPTIEQMREALTAAGRAPRKNASDESIREAFAELLAGQG